MLEMLYELTGLWSKTAGTEQFHDEHKREREKELIGTLNKLTQWHVTPATQIGFGAACLSRRLHSAMHSIRLECFTHDMLCKYIKEFVCWLFDYGTEYGIGYLKPVQDLFPYWRDQPCVTNYDALPAVADLPPDEDTPDFFAEMNQIYFLF